LNNYQSLSESYPFLTFMTHVTKKEYIGIVQNSNEKFISFYDYESIKNHEDRMAFLKLGEIWYWESNRALPINIFLFEQMKIFSDHLKIFQHKDVTINAGIMVSLENLAKKRVKKKTIQLIRKV
jgi:hypothetical protein